MHSDSFPQVTVLCWSNALGCLYVTLLSTDLSTLSQQETVQTKFCCWWRQCAFCWVSVDILHLPPCVVQERHWERRQTNFRSSDQRSETLSLNYLRDTTDNINNNLITIGESWQHQPNVTNQTFHNSSYIGLQTRDLKYATHLKRSWNKIVLHRHHEYIHVYVVFSVDGDRLSAMFYSSFNSHVWKTFSDLNNLAHTHNE